MNNTLHLRTRSELQHKVDGVEWNVFEADRVCFPFLPHQLEIETVIAALSVTVCASGRDKTHDDKKRSNNTFSHHMLLGTVVYTLVALPGAFESLVYIEKKRVRREVILTEALHGVPSTTKREG
jgi:hypothetical protein